MSTVPKESSASHPGRKPSKTGRVVRTVLSIILILALFFVPAGTVRWPEAWLLLGMFLAVSLGVMAWWKKHVPSLLEERMSTKKDAKAWDHKIMTAYTILLFALLAVPGLDAVRFHWSAVPLWAKALGFLGYIPALGIALWAMKENAFLSDVVRVQKDRGHTVCTTGPYRYIRHPMYTGVIMCFLFFPLALGSLYSYLPVVAIVGLFILRTALEDKMLKAELPGYMEYAEKVRYRLLPGVW